MCTRGPCRSAVGCQLVSAAQQFDMDSISPSINNTLVEPHYFT